MGDGCYGLGMSSVTKLGADVVGAWEDIYLSIVDELVPSDGNMGLTRASSPPSDGPSPSSDIAKV